MRHKFVLFLVICFSLQLLARDLFCQSLSLDTAKPADVDEAKSQALVNISDGDRNGSASNPQLAAAIDDSLHFTLVVTPEGMAQKTVKLVAKKYLGNVPTKINMRVNTALFTLSDYLHPFVEDAAGSFFFSGKPGDKMVTFNVKADTVSFGWIADLSNHLVGFADSAVVVADWGAIGQTAIEIQQGTNWTNINNYTLRVVRPAGMPVYSPFLTIPGSETFIVYGGEVRQKHVGSGTGNMPWSPIALGSFDADSVVYKNGHNAYFLSYGIDASKGIDLLRRTYDMMMKRVGLEDYPEFSPRARSFVFLPALPSFSDPQISYPRVAGLFSYGFSNDPYIWIPEITEDLYDLNYSINNAINIRSIANLVGSLDHSVYGLFFPGDEFRNGNVKFLQLLELKDAGVIDDLFFESQMVMHVNFYNREIAGLGSPLDSLNGTLEPNMYRYTQFFLFFEVLNRIAKENTGNTRDFLDAQNVFMQKLRAAGGPDSYKTTKSQQYQWFIEAYMEVTGLDITELINQCVFGTPALVPLPIAVNYNTVYLKPTKWSKGFIPPPSPDIDTDGKLDTGDAIKLMRITVDNPGATVIDQNNDGKLSIADAVKLLLKIRDKNKKKDNEK